MKAVGGSGVLQNSGFACLRLIRNTFLLSTFICMLGVTLGAQVYSRGTWISSAVIASV